MAKLLFTIFDACWSVFACEIQTNLKLFIIAIISLQKIWIEELNSDRLILQCIYEVLNAVEDRHLSGFIKNIFICVLKKGTKVLQFWNDVRVHKYNLLGELSL